MKAALNLDSASVALYLTTDEAEALRFTAYFILKYGADEFGNTNSTTGRSLAEVHSALAFAGVRSIGGTDVGLTVQALPTLSEDSECTCEACLGINHDDDSYFPDYDEEDEG